MVWEDSSVARGFVPGAIFGKRVAAGGQVLDATPIDIMAGNTPDVAALGSTFLVVDTFEQTNHIRLPEAVRVDGTGAVLGDPGQHRRNYSAACRRWPRWATAGWRSGSAAATHDNPATVNIQAAFVNPDGTGAGAFPVAGIAAGLQCVSPPALASGPTQALISYYCTCGHFQDKAISFARRITARRHAAGQRPRHPGDNGPRRPVPAPPPPGTAANMPWPMKTTAAVPFLDRPVSDVYATRVDSNGTVLDPSGVAVGNARSPKCTRRWPPTGAAT